MKFVKALAILWGLVYFVVGYLKAFTLNNVDFWTSMVALFAIFLLPFPIAIMAIWLQRIAGFALLVCAAAGMINAVIAASMWSSTSFTDKSRFLLFIAMWLIPHLIFALAFIFTASARNANLE